MREILLKYTKIVLFIFRVLLIYKQDGVIMDYPLGQILAEIFMGHLERSLVLLLAADLNF